MSKKRVNKEFNDDVMEMVKDFEGVDDEDGARIATYRNDAASPEEHANSDAKITKTLQNRTFYTSRRLRTKKTIAKAIPKAPPVPVTNILIDRLRGNLKNLVATEPLFIAGEEFSRVRRFLSEKEFAQLKKSGIDLDCPTSYYPNDISCIEIFRQWTGSQCRLLQLQRDLVKDIIGDIIFYSPLLALVKEIAASVSQNQESLTKDVLNNVLSENNGHCIAEEQWEFLCKILIATGKNIAFERAIQLPIGV